VIAATQQRLEGYLESFERFEKSAPGQDVPWLQKLRRAAFARFCEVGFPTARVEDWRFTDVSGVAGTAFQLAAKTGGFLGRNLAPLAQSAFKSCTLAFVDGKFAPELSSLPQPSPKLRIESLARMISQNPAALEPYLGRYLDTRRDPFCALNTAFLEDGAWIHIAKDAVVDAPIYLLFVSSGQEAPTMSHTRNLIVIEPGSEVTFVEDHASAGETKSFCTNATELIAGHNASVSHYRIERMHAKAYYFSTLRVQQGRNANVASHSVLIGGALARNNVHPVLAGEGGECLINGLFVGSGRQHLDNYMLVEHASPHCSSRQFYNGILDDHAHGVFHGRIVVHKDAQKTDAKQTNRNLLLSDDVQMDTKPQLEIFADDVKCTHGATIGQIEENALFYLRSRGIDEVSARHLLLLAFAGECLDRMKDGPARKYAEQLIHGYVFEVAGAFTNRQTDARSVTTGG
jgi:Fe-S cluster assembly protein SufD